MSKELIELLELEPHPEGGFYRRTYSSEVKFKDKTGERAVGSAIYYYLSSDDFSAWHRLDADEMLHFYAGTSVTIHMIGHEGQLSHVTLGNPAVDSNLQPQVWISKGHWFALEVDCENTYALIGATVFPGFKSENFELAKRDELIAEYPQHQDIITRLTRE